MASLFTRLFTAAAAGALILLSNGAGAQAPQTDSSNSPSQTRSGAPQETFSQAELEQLVAPIALYPDSLLAYVLIASTYPQEVVEASRWVDQNKSLQGSELEAAADEQRWDYSVKQLTATASVLAMMSDKLDWTEKLGDAVLAQQPDVMDAVQRLRATALSYGKLKTTDEQKVSRRTEGGRDAVGAGAQAPQTDSSSSHPQTQSGAPQETFSQAELEQLVAPIALYPDSLLAYVLIASTYPQEVVEASRWVDQNKSLQGSELEAAADEQRWDYSVKQLTATASVLAMMSDKLDWTEKLGDAVLAQQPDVMDAVQRLRATALSYGKLKTTAEQKVSRRTEDSRDAVVAAATETTDEQKVAPPTEGSRDAVVVAATETPDEQKVSPPTEGSRDAVVVAATETTDEQKLSPPTEGSGDAVVAAATETTDEQKVAPPTEGSRDAVVVAATETTDEQKVSPPTEGSGDAVVVTGTTDEQKVSRRTEGSRNAVVVAATKTTDEQKVSRRRGSRDAIVIEATNPKTIYVPYYDPAVVYGEWPYPDYPPYYWPGYYYGPDLLTAGIVFAAFGVGAWAVHDSWWGGDFDWHRHHIHHHHRRDVNNNNRDAKPWRHDADHRRGVRYKNRDVAAKFDRHRDNRAARKVSRDNERVADRDRRDRRADVDNRAGSDRKASQKRAANKQVQRADRSQKRFVQGPAARHSGLRADAGRHRMQAGRDRPSQMRMPADLDRRSFAAQRGVDRAMRGFGGGVDRAMRGFGGRRR